jgi:serine protein kinase
MEWIDKAKKETESQNETFSFPDYMNYFKENPERECRPSYQYLLEMLEHFGINKDHSFKLFDAPDPDSQPVYGQIKTQQAIYQNLKNFQNEGLNNKFILLVGPNGSAKSSIIRKFMKGAEDYSKEREGALYTFSWIFPIDKHVKGTLGLNAQMDESDVSTFAYLEDKDISAIISSELKDHPLLLVPKKYRQELITDGLVDFPELSETVQKSYLYHGDLSKKNHMIYDAMLKNYKGDHQEVLKHIRVERITISKRYSSSAVTIEPQLHVDAQIQQITMDKRLASLPPSLQSLNLFQLNGEIVLANRGILEFSDLLKRPLDTYKYLLMTMESSTINLQGILTQLDIFFAGTSNEIHLAAFKQHPDFNSFKGRFNFIKVPYLLDYKQEKKIYIDQMNSLIQEKCHFEPHAIDCLSMFAVMTRLRPAQAKNYQDKKLAQIVTSLNPIEKVSLLSGKKMPDRLDGESKQVLGMGLPEIQAEFENDSLYEGKFGLSPRDLKNILYKLSSRYQNISFIEILEYLEKLILKKNDYDFLNMTAQGDYHHPPRFLSLIKTHYLNIFDEELRVSLGLVDDRSYEDYIKRYIENINALIKGEKIKNDITGKFEDGSQYFIKEFETNINLREKPEAFRSHLISTLGAYSLDNPGKVISYTEVFSDLVKRLKESFRSEQKKFIKSISKNLVFYKAEKQAGEEKITTTTPMSENDREKLEKIIQNLQDEFNYSHDGAISLLQMIIKERY